MIKSCVAFQWHPIGTTLVYLATNAYNAYKVLTGAVLDTHTNFLTVRRDQFDQMKDLSFIFSGVCI